MMGQNILKVSYTGLLGLEIIIDVDFLKWDSQYLRLIHKLAILTKFVIYLMSVTKTLR